MTPSVKETGPVLVTGASGFVGSHLARSLVLGGSEVHALVRKDSVLSRLQDILPKLRLEYGDLSDKESIKRVVAAVKPRGIFHLGVSNVVSGVGAETETLIKTNVAGTAHLLDAAAGRGFDFFVHIGSFLEYGVKAHPVREDERCEPGELYGVSKLAGTLYAQALGRREKLPVIVFRLFTPYGPQNDPRRFVATVISKALKNEPIALTSPRVSRDFIFVEDAVELFLEGAGKAGALSGEIFNAGTGVRTTLEEAVLSILKKTASQSEVKWGSFREVSYDSNDWQADMGKTFSHVSWRPKHSLKEGLDRAIAYFKAHGV
ncbi:MAG: NAD-dependent epimerase/dehydratase family protein [Patescibacteria group bacterium]